jgi:FkbM family methyltransferase
MINVLKDLFNHPLNKTDKMGALARFAKWQLNTRLNPHPVVHQFTENSKLLMWKGLKGATGNVYCGLHDFEDMSFLLHLLRPTDLFIDIGANVGSYTVLASAEIGAETISIEPLPATCQHLEDNILINKIQDKVQVKNIGLGSQQGIIKFTTTFDTINHVATAEETETIDVAVDTLDNVIAERNKLPLLLKIDVEGFETEVVKGADKVLKNNELKAIIIELNGSGNRYGYDETKIHDTFLSLGFSPYIYHPFERKLTLSANFGTHNTIYVRDIEFVQERLKTARQITVNDRKI